jgi:hypothetical protein
LAAAEPISEFSRVRPDAVNGFNVCRQAPIGDLAEG